MGRRKSLVQIQVHEIYAEIARAHFSDQSVHVGAVHVQQTAFSVKNVGDLVDLLLEDSQRVWVRQHQRGDIFVHLRRKGGDVDHPVGI